MTPQEISQVRDSYAQLGDTRAFAQRFYALLFERRPDARQLFPVNLDAQVQKLADMLQSIVDSLEFPDRLERQFAELGRRHAAYGVQEADYDDVGTALLKALRDRLGSRYTESVEQAWGKVYGDLAEAMIAAQTAITAPAG